jgi:protein TonB
VYLYPSKRVFLSFVTLSLLFAVSVPRARSQQQSGTDEPVYEAGGEVKPPKLIHYVEPAFSAKSKEAYVEGIVKISTVVTTAGSPTKLQVLKGLNAEEDRTAMEAVQQWRFEPGTRKGQAVNVRVTVEISFHLL